MNTGKTSKKNISKVYSKPTRKAAEEAVKTLIKKAGENHDRESLLEAPKRVANS